jgi:diguanylate cyclase (GGDEF)-like protein
MVATCVCLLLVVAAAGATLRGLSGGPDQVVWRRLLLGATVLAAGALAAGLLSLPGASDDRLEPVAAVLFALAAVVGAALLYQGLIHWNRLRTHVADPGDWLNGLGSGLVVAAATDLLLPHDPSWSTGGAWQRHASLLAFGGLFIATGSGVAMIRLGGLVRDRRVWLVLAALGLLLVPTGLGVLAAGSTAGAARALVVPAVALIVLAARSPAGRSAGPVAATNRETSNGSIVVVVAAVATLIGCGLSNRPVPWATACAAVAAVGVSTRLLRLVRDLEQLAYVRRLAMTDELTGVANRRALMAALAADLRGERGVQLLMVNVSGVKLVNDRHGHAIGDDLLRLAAGVLGRHVPDRGLLARLGGSEFTVQLPGFTEAMAVELGHRLVALIAGIRQVGGRPVRVGATVGIASSGTLRGRHPDTATGELIRRADSAMYAAETAGTTLGVFDQDADDAVSERVQLLEDLAEALGPRHDAASPIVAFYQPQVDVRSGRVTGAEALVRWHHPRLGLLTPDAFVELAEQHGLIGALTVRVMRQAAAQWHRCRAAGRPVRISVNLSASCLTDPDLPVLLDDLTREGLDPAGFVLEITETSLMADPEAALATLADITRRGFAISIDDYGTGYSSLTYLNVLPASELKIDRTFVQRLTSDPRTAAIIAGTIDLAHHLDLRLVAEGVEDQATLEALLRLGCDESQGFHIARPMPAADLDRWLEARPDSWPHPPTGVPAPRSPQGAATEGHR